MGHYWSEMRGPETKLERKQRLSNSLVTKLRKHQASRFSVDQIGLLLRTNWSRFQESYREEECDAIIAMGVRAGVVTTDAVKAALAEPEDA